MAAAVLDASSVNIALPSIASALRVEPSAAAWLVIAYQGALVASLLPLAAIGERFGCRPAFIAGAALFALCAAASSLTPGFALLVAFRAFQGVGAAAIMALGVALLRHTVAEEEFGRAIGWNAMTVALFSAAGPAIGALFLGLGSWRFVFAGSVALAAMAIATGCALPSRHSEGKKLDGIGMLAYAAIVPAFVIAAGMMRQSSLAAALLLAGGTAGLGLLVRRDLRRDVPFLPLPLFRSPCFARSVMASVLCFTALGLALLVLPFALHERLGLSPGGTALMMTPWPVAVLLTTPMTTCLLNRTRPAKLCTVGAIVLALGLATLAAVPPGWGASMHVAGIVLCGIGFGLFQTPNNRNIFLAAPADRAASAGGVQGTARLAGQVTGALATSILLSAATVEIASSFAFAVAGLAALASACMSWLNIRESDSYSTAFEIAPAKCCQAASCSALSMPPDPEPNTPKPARTSVDMDDNT